MDALLWAKQADNAGTMILLNKIMETICVEAKKRTIMVVDDSLTVRMQIKDLLEKEGYKVILAKDGETCLAQLKAELPDIILLDIVMPGINGLEVCRIIRDDSSLKSISLLILTTISDTQNIVAGLNMGADDYVTKPFIIEELNARITAIIRTKSLQEELRILSITDPLTGCYNRSYLNEHLTSEIKRACRYKHALSMIMCDIDFFKNVNDTYGHQAGDHVLKELIICIKKLFRDKIDWVSRYGGEEFIIILPETDNIGGSSFAEKIRIAVSMMKINLDDNRKISITASFGAVSFNPDTPEKNITSELMIKKADECLYQAKKKGRNRVVGGQL